MVELIIMNSGDAAHFIQMDPVEVGHLVAQMDVVLLVAGFFGCMGREYKSFPDLLDISAELQIQIKNGGHTMGFVEVIDIGRVSDLVEQSRTSDPEENELCHFSGNIRIVESVSDRLGDIIVFRNVRTQEEERSTLEGFRCQVEYLDPYRCVVDDDLIPDAGILKKIVHLFIPLHLQGLILVPGLIVVPVFPEDADADEVLAQFKGTAQMGTREKTETTAVDLEGLVHREFHREVSNTLRVGSFCGVWHRELSKVSHSRANVAQENGMSTLPSGLGFTGRSPVYFFYMYLKTGI